MSRLSTSFSSSSTTAVDAYFQGLEGSKPLSADKEAACARTIDDARSELWVALLGERSIHKKFRKAVAGCLKLDEQTSLDLDGLELMHRPGRPSTAAAEGENSLFLKDMGTRLARADVDDELAGVLTRDIANVMSNSEPVVHIRLSARTVAAKGFENFVSKIASCRARMHRAKNNMAKANLRLVVQMAKRYTYSSIPLMDLVQEGNIGLLKAVDRFEVDKGFRFSTYASWWIRHALTRCVYNGSSTVRVPVHVQERQRQITKARRELELRGGEAASVTEVAERVGLSIEKVRAADGVKSYRTLSFHSPTHPGSLTTLEELIADPDEVSSFDMVSDANLRESIEPAYGVLDAVEFDILKRRFGLEGEEHQTLRAVGVVHGLSRERIRQIQTRALDKMRVCIESGAAAYN